MRISEIKGIGEKIEKVFNKAGVELIDDLLKYYPRNYDIFEEPVLISDLEVNTMSAIKARVVKTPDVRRVRNLVIVNCFFADSTGQSIKATWFNAPYLKNTLKVGSEYIIRGIINAKNGAFIIEHPKLYSEREYNQKMGEMQPIYPLVSGLTNNIVIKSVKQALDIYKDEVDYLPEIIKEKYDLPDINYAIKNIHFPTDKQSMLIARKRLVFDEFFSFIYTLSKYKEDGGVINNNYVLECKNEIDEIIEKLPYKLTNAQQNTWEEIKKDIASDKTMNRLIQGDVGSGKTIIAILSLFNAALNGYQGALMAPTEVLAKQHYVQIQEMIKEHGLPFEAVFLSGSMTAKEKREACKAIVENEKIKIIVGTHAIFQKNVEYRNLALVVTDEQHRFGVRQREAINLKGNHPHVIVMSATPIPRTLAIIMYGNLDISIIDELPANRLPIKNCVVGNEYRPNAYRFMEKQIAEGRQIYIICPTVEHSEAIEGENVIDYCDKLQKIFPPSVNIQFLHGRMKQSEKNEVMERFERNEIQILVSTTVVEVGVNVPNATVMMIENAERFGLAGLHQLRGRVGRGGHQSYCIFINGAGKKDASKRLDILAKSNDGFYIAGEDLKLRGPGDFFGVRQSGDMDFKLGDIYSDSSIVKMAKDAVGMLEDGSVTMDDYQKTLFDRQMNNYVRMSEDRINL